MGEIVMSNLWKRVLLTNIAVPTVFFVIFFPVRSHILLFILFGFLVTFLGSYELSSLIYNKGIKVNKFFVPLVNTFIYTFAYLWANNVFNIHSYKAAPYLFGLTLIIIVSFIYAADIFKKSFEKSFEKMSYTIFALLYIGLPSFCVPFLLNIDISPIPDIDGFINVKPHGSMFGSFLVLYLIICIWVNDIFAYVFGVTFGKNNKLGLSVSPNKSLAGYLGGYFTTFIFVAVFYFFFKSSLDKLPAAFYFITPFFTGFLVHIGDLVESVFKRSANVKDSGKIIMGRGGVLDSVDTLLFLMPIYFFSLQLIFAVMS